MTSLRAMCDDISAGRPAEMSAPQAVPLPSPSVAFDELLAHSIRELLADEPGVSEKKMFGGLAFLVQGNMAIAASRDGGALVRVDPAQADKIVASTGAEIAVMQGRPMRGWLRVSADDVRTIRQVGKWVKLSAGYARSLPPKR